MRKNAFLTLMMPLLLCSCAPSTNGGYRTYDASPLPKTASKEEKTVKINGSTFVIYNVYKDDDNNFILKDNSSYIQNKSMVFGVKIASGLGRIYDISKDSSDIKECEVMFDEGGWRGYSIQTQGFEISIDKQISMLYQDINIGKIVSWC